MNNTWKCALFMCGKVSVAWKRKMLHDKMLHDIIGGHQAYIRRFMGHRNFCSWLRPCVVSRLRTRQVFKVATTAPSFTWNKYSDRLLNVFEIPFLKLESNCFSVISMIPTVISDLLYVQLFPGKKQQSYMCSPSCLFMLILFLGLKNDNNFGRTGCKESQFYSLIFGQDVASFE